MVYLDIFINKTDNQPLYYQLYSELAARIRSGEIPAREKLPSKRSAAAQLGVSVNTVDTAYQMLAAEGYVQAKARSAFCVCELKHQIITPPPKDFALNSGISDDTAKYKYSFATGGLNEQLFPRKTWAKLLRETLNEEPNLFSRGQAEGEAVLRAEIANYLKAFRGVRCSAKQVVVGAGLEVLLSMLARIFSTSTFALENPGYLKMTRIISNMGVNWCGLPVDKMGMNPKALQESGADIAYITPSHQYPSGAVMPAPRRSQLLHWAAGGQRYIIEDDHDSEFRFDGRPLPSLQGLDNADKVIYAGTFSRSLAQGLRAAYLVLPLSVLKRWQTAYASYACTVSRPEQYTLAHFMAGGHFARNINTARGKYRAVRDELINALHSVLPAGDWQLENTHTGLYFVLRMAGINAADIAAKARESGVEIRALSEYALCCDAAHEIMRGALVLGYGGLRKQDVLPAAEALSKTII